VRMHNPSVTGSPPFSISPRFAALPSTTRALRSSAQSGATSAESSAVGGWSGI
jgi:hypothetical protein